MMCLVSICIMSPGADILNPLGNLALGLRAALLLFADFFLSTKPLLLKILPTVLSHALYPSLLTKTPTLYFDQAGYCLLNWHTRSTTWEEVMGTLVLLGLLDLSLQGNRPSLL